ncbi:hypothetical protein EDI_153770 [Entamoeba dispar SAW760]|uniref:TLDc domain-containing protein n=1 Tax=Entamoeba dispar (strain ATCC PRA-260 / SAW760) TaxID=370354 RepID=B0E9D1_ENTDS|nr:uncharacterized protein EDI_153770 [Entamoeba dispar SAW760]EDR28865.1 hypothetical protein EDI_153770 [Entamoeba dispar SAW760]|eukprot:EDR28865.1 hypothetical protein EDI_153770 [Entamoeba dispar SAW760]
MDFQILKTKAVGKRIKEDIDHCFERYKQLWEYVSADFDDFDRRTKCNNFRELRYSELENLSDNCSAMISKRKQLIIQFQEMAELATRQIQKQNEEIRRMRIVQERCYEEMKAIDSQRNPLTFIESDGEYSPKEQNNYTTEKKPIVKPINERKSKQKTERTNEMNETLIYRCISKVYNRVCANSSTQIYDSNIDGWDKYNLGQKLEGQKKLMVVVFPIYYEPFGCYINHPFKKEGWNGDIHSFFYCFAEDQFFWVYKFLKGVQERDVFRISYDNDKTIFQLGRYINIQKNPVEGISSVSLDIQKCIETRKGNFIGSFSSKEFVVNRFIVLQMK